MPCTPHARSAQDRPRLAGYRRCALVGWLLAAFLAHVYGAGTCACHEGYACRSGRHEVRIESPPSDIILALGQGVYWDTAVTFAEWEERLVGDDLDVPMSAEPLGPVVRFQSPVPTSVPASSEPSPEPPDCPSPQPFGPPVNTSWMYRPWSIGLAYGMLRGSEAIDDWVTQGTGSFGAVRLGMDLDDRWGLELRYGFGAAPLYDSIRAMTIRESVDTQAGMAANSPLRYYYAKRRNSDRKVMDLSVLLYPGGDKRCRPYLLAGLGFADFRFSDALRVQYSNSVVDMPLAVGLKYLVAERLALRLEACDTIIFSGGAGINTLHDFTLTGGLELRLGGSRRSYWPWAPGDHAW